LVSSMLLRQSRLVLTMALALGLGPESTPIAAGARHTGGRPLRLSTRIGAVSPAPGSPGAAAMRGHGCDPLHSTRRPPLSLGVFSACVWSRISHIPSNYVVEWSFLIENLLR
jgi:hypothetical protein